MTAARPQSYPPNEIDSLAFDFDVADHRSPMASPDRMMVAIRQELLATIDQCIDFAALGAEDVQVPAITLDLGAFDDPPDWDAVRQTLQDDLLSALSPYLRHPDHLDDSGESTDARPPTAQVLTSKIMNLQLTGQSDPPPEVLRAAITKLSDQDISELAQRLNGPGLRSITPDDIPALRAALYDDAMAQRTKPMTAVQSMAEIRETLTGSQTPARETVLAALQGLSETALRSLIARLNLQHQVMGLSHSALISAVTKVLLPDAADTATAHRLDDPNVVQFRNILAQSTFNDGLAAKQTHPQPGSPDQSTETDIFPLLFSNLIDVSEVDTLLQENIPEDAAHLKAAIAGLSNASSPDAAKRMALAAVLQQRPVDIAAAQEATDAARHTPELTLARLFVAMGDSPTKAAQRITDLTFQTTTKDVTEATPQEVSGDTNTDIQERTHPETADPSNNTEAVNLVAMGDGPTKATQRITDLTLQTTAKVATDAAPHEVNGDADADVRKRTHPEPTDPSNDNRAANLAEDNRRPEPSDLDNTADQNTAAAPRSTQTGDQTTDADAVGSDSPMAAQRDRQDVEQDGSTGTTTASSDIPAQSDTQQAQGNPTPDSNTDQGRTSGENLGVSHTHSDATTTPNTTVGVDQDKTHGAQASSETTQASTTAGHPDALDTPSNRDRDQADADARQTKTAITPTGQKSGSSQAENHQRPRPEHDIPSKSLPTDTDVAPGATPRTGADATATDGPAQTGGTAPNLSADISSTTNGTQNAGPATANNDQQTGRDAPDQGARPSSVERDIEPIPRPTATKAKTGRQSPTHREDQAKSTTTGQDHPMPAHGVENQTDRALLKPTQEQSSPSDQSGSKPENATTGQTSKRTGHKHVPHNTPTDSKADDATSQSDAGQTHDHPQQDRTAETEALLDALLNDMLPASQSDIKATFKTLAAVLGGETAGQARTPATFWAAALNAAATAASQTPASAHALTTKFANNLLETRQNRTRALRNAIARLNYAAAGSQAARQQAQATLEAMLTPAGTPSAQSTTPTTEASQRFDTQTAGLILFHPYLAMLFERLEIGRDRNAIRPDALGTARSALDHLAHGDALPDVPADTLQKCLLGLPPDAPSPARTPLDRAASDLIDSLIQSVISQWGKLGNTSADGLRAAFVQRGGVVQFESAERHVLTVNNGPYDMLLDALPWSINMVSLPWMTAPLFVDWRDRDD